MRQFYRHWKGRTHDYFLYCNWVRHFGFGRPRLKVNYKPNSYSVHLFDFSCGKLHIYLVKANKSKWGEYDKPIKVKWIEHYDD